MTFNFAAILAPQYLELLWQSILRTCGIAICAWLIAFAAGLVLVSARVSPIAPLRFVVATYVEMTRNIPLLVQMMFWYFAMPTLLPQSAQNYINTGPSETILATLALGFCVSGYFTEIFRSGIQSVPRVQYEATRAIGFSYLQTMRYVILPLALRQAIPPIMNMTLILLKGTSIASAIGVLELSAVARRIENETFLTFEVFSIVTIIYLLICALVNAVGGALERRYAVR